MNWVSLPVTGLLLLTLTVVVALVEARSAAGLRRHRREWVLPPQKLEENKDHTNKEYIAKIRSDSDDGTGNVQYSLRGKGADKYPFNRFVVDPDTGFVRVTKLLDREDIDTYILDGLATFRNGTEAEKNIELRIMVVDQNDNPPVFSPISPGEVYELSPVGTFVMKISATDADDPKSNNSMIAYSIIKQDPPGDKFTISKDGEISVRQPSLDREMQDTYTLIVKGADLYGQPGSNSATASVLIKIKDVNDNPPIPQFEQYEGYIEENTEGVEVMRIKVSDLDLENTDNTAAIYDIVKGNEAGYFNIYTDSKTNEGVLMLVKPVDYEDVKDLDIRLAIRNKAPPYNGVVGGGGAGIGIGGVAESGGGGAGAGGGTGSGAGGGNGGSGSTGGWSLPGSGGSSSSSWFSGGGVTGNTKLYPVKINVKNKPEGPHFDPKVKAIPVSENGKTVKINEVIAKYPAIDGDTLRPAENVRYARGSDPDNWLIIDEKTGDIKLNKLPDRESKYLVNGTYYAQILCMSQDTPSKTATGTIAIQVEDFNDHCPTLTSQVQTMCTTSSVVYLTAVDADPDPNSAPFSFTIIKASKGNWTVERLNDTTAILHTHESLWPGSYKVTLEIRDQQGLACPDLQEVKVDVCTCKDEGTCGARSLGSKGADLGAAGLGLLFLGLLMLLLIPLLLLFCTCGGPGTFTEMPFHTKAHLISYHTEGQGENTEVPLLSMPMQVDSGMAQTIGMGMGTASAAAVGGGAMIMGGAYKNSSSTIGGGFYQEGHVDMAQMNRRGVMSQQQGGGFYSEFEAREGGGVYDGIALPDYILEAYYSQKVSCAAENNAQTDSLLVYDYEGQGSPVGSVGCCSLLESDNDLQFLDDLGLKFKTLAEICQGEKIQTEIRTSIPSLPMPKPAVSMATTTSTNVTMASSAVSAPARAPPPAPVAVTNVERTVATSSEHSATHRQGLGVQGQTILVQQPVFYTTTPMLQPMQYVLEPQVHNTVLLADRPTAANLQGMVVVKGPPTGSGQMMVQGQRVVSSGPAQAQGMVFVERGGGGGQARLDGGNAGLIQMGNFSGSRNMLMVEGQVPMGSGQVLQGAQFLQGGQVLQGEQVLQGGQTWVQQGSLQSGGLSGPHSLLVMEGQDKQAAQAHSTAHLG